ncbi:MAG: TetR/AcrR family transcriptional regulator [Gemmatimonadaceae bacterium]|nr:TetR/AcrR family transcriptional regulator [Gemmatimonadaceae bacterium]NUQ94470.1 TetR/AcrR family transcriptional regulator [Gemmatimonadaceae bacterium]NUR32442.1 TetR/AcrR family transcriptional regulator [Gemmatimonadaceae bacterium]NUS97863.1 TetR/AcrR family transcriptional regulator [Gemmatimonadaceae bacterium]
MARTTEREAKRARRGRALRWERRPDDRPGELLDAAMTVFAEKGYRNTRLEEIAEAAGVTKGTIYHYFSTKEELLLRAIEQHHERVFGRLAEELREVAGPASERIRLFIRRGFGGTERAGRGVLALLVLGIAHEVPDAYRQWIASGPVEGWKLLARLVDEGRRAGEFRADVDAEVAARVLISGLLLQSIWQQHASGVRGLAIPEKRLLDEATELFLAGLRGTPSG